MHAVVSEPGGTAYDYFKGSELFARGIRIYGKTGSTENPENAWFAGYAEDRRAARIAIAVVVEGGKHGGSDAAPMGRAIFELCGRGRIPGQLSRDHKEIFAGVGSPARTPRRTSKNFSLSGQRMPPSRGIGSSSLPRKRDNAGSLISFAQAPRPSFWT